jgi:hypothetical protein
MFPRSDGARSESWSMRKRPDMSSSGNLDTKYKLVWLLYNGTGCDLIRDDCK